MVTTIETYPRSSATQICNKDHPTFNGMMMVMASVLILEGITSILPQRTFLF